MCDIAHSAVAYGEKQPTETANIVEVFEVANFLGRQSCFIRHGADLFDENPCSSALFPCPRAPSPTLSSCSAPQVSLAGFIAVARPCPVLAGRPLPASPVAAGPCRAGAESILPLAGGCRGGL